MQSQYQKQVLDPYKTIGSFVHGPMAASSTSPYSLAAACTNSFKVYSPELAIKMVSPCFEGPIRAIQTANQLTYVVVGERVYKMRYHHIVGKWEIPQRKTNKKGKGSRSLGSMLLFADVILVSEDSHVYVIYEKERKAQEEQIDDYIDLGFPITNIVHPVGYLNKIIAYNHENIVLLNPITAKVLFKYSSIVTDHVKTHNARISIIQPTPLIDIIALGLDQGEILVINIRNAKLVFKMKQKRPVSALAFSHSEPYMASADEMGNILLWDLEEKKIVYRLEAALTHSIDHLFFVPGMDLLIAASTYANSIRQFRINRDDSKTLSLFRERIGSHENILGINVQNNKEITFLTPSSMHFTSLYSHCNNYSLPITTCCLHSVAPYYLFSSHFNIEIYKERTIFCKFNIHEVAELGAISLSQKYAIVVSRSKMIKMSISPNNKESNKVSLISAECALSPSLNPSEIILNNEHLIYLICYDSINVYDFDTLSLVTVVNEGKRCYHAVSNHFSSMLALENRTDETIEMWDCQKMVCGRKFPIRDSNSEFSTTTTICFTSDNRFVLSAHCDCRLMVWSMLDNVLYKVLVMESPLVSMTFTPDGSYFLSAFEHRKEINIWNSYIGKITTNQQQSDRIPFRTELRWLEPDYRLVLNRESKLKQEEIIFGEEFREELDSLLDQIDDATDGEAVENYNFKETNKWMPLVYYDEIKARNTVQGDEDLKATSSIPFFLDFKNIDEEKKKLTQEIKKELMEKKQAKDKKRDQLLTDDLHSILLDSNSSAADYSATWSMLSKLSAAQLDYQLRKFLLTPGNGLNLVHMFTYLIKRPELNHLELNVVLTRSLDLLGSDLFSEDVKEHLGELKNVVSEKLERQEETVERSLAIMEHI